MGVLAEQVRALSGYSHPQVATVSPTSPPLILRGSGRRQDRLRPLRRRHRHRDHRGRAAAGVVPDRTVPCGRSSSSWKSCRRRRSRARPRRCLTLCCQRGSRGLAAAWTQADSTEARPTLTQREIMHDDDRSGANGAGRPHLEGVYPNPLGGTDQHLDGWLPARRLPQRSTGRQPGCGASARRSISAHCSSSRSASPSTPLALADYAVGPLEARPRSGPSSTAGTAARSLSLLEKSSRADTASS